MICTTATVYFIIITNHKGPTLQTAGKSLFHLTKLGGVTTVCGAYVRRAARLAPSPRAVVAGKARLSRQEEVVRARETCYSVVDCYCAVSKVEVRTFWRGGVML